MYRKLIRCAAHFASPLRRPFASRAAILLAVLFGAGACDDSSSGTAEVVGKAGGTPRGGIAAADVPPATRPASAPQTRPADAGPYTWHDFYREALAFNRWTIVGAYRDHGRHGPWDAAAERFLDRHAAHLTGSEVVAIYRPADWPQQKDLLAEAAALVAGGCTDPLVRYYHGALLNDTGNAAAAAPILREAAIDMMDSGYPPFRKVAAARRGRKAARDSFAAGKFAAADAEAARLVQGPLSGIERRKVLDVMTDFLEDRKPAQVVDAIARLQQAGGADPWVLDVLAGRTQIKLAWESRGSGWADSVTDEGWQGFFQHLTLARDHLVRAWKLAPELPEAPTSMITVAMGGSGALRERPMTWFERAERAQVDYHLAYSTMWGGPLLPRWGGSHFEIYQLGLRGVRSGRYDTDLPRQLVGALIAIARDREGNWDVLDDPEVYDELCTVLDRYVAQPGRPAGDVDWDRSLRAAAAWRTDRFDEARAALERLGERAKPGAFEVFGAKSPAATIGQVYAMTGPEAARVQRAEAALKAGNWVAARSEFRDAAEALAADKVAQPYFDARIAVLDGRVNFGGGDWIDVQPRNGLTGWKEVTGEWSAEPDRAIVVQPHDKQSSSLRFQERLGTRFEVSGRISAMADEPWAAGLELSSGGTRLGAVIFSTDGVTLSHGGKPLAQAKAEITDGVEFVYRFENGKVTVTVGATPLIAAHLMPREYLNGHDVGLIVPARSRARFTDLKVRKLPVNFPGATAAPDNPAER